jgi:hypothetical protein
MTLEALVQCRIWTQDKMIMLPDNMQQAIAKTHAKWSAYQIPSVIVVFVILVFKV